jgi:hypothetical protein
LFSMFSWEHTDTYTHKRVPCILLRITKCLTLLLYHKPETVNLPCEETPVENKLLHLKSERLKLASSLTRCI